MLWKLVGSVAQKKSKSKTGSAKVKAARKSSSKVEKAGRSASAASRAKKTAAEAPVKKKGAKKKTAKKTAKKTVKKTAKKTVKKKVVKAVAKKGAKKTSAVAKKVAKGKKVASTRSTVRTNTAAPAKRTTRAAKKAGSAVMNPVAKRTTGAGQKKASLPPVVLQPLVEVKVPKTRLSPEELETFKQLLLDKRAELSGDVRNLSRDTLGHRTSRGSSHSSMPIHMADLGSDNWEHEFTLGLIENEQDRIREIDDALERIRNRTYGVCLATHRRISKARLRAKPWAKFCIEHARALEEGRAR